MQAPSKCWLLQEMMPKTSPCVHVELRIAKASWETEQSCPFFFIIIITMRSPKGRDLGLLCSQMSYQHLEQCLAVVDWWHEGPQFFASPCIHTMPFAMWLAFLSLKRQLLLPLRLESGLSLWLALSSRRQAEMMMSLDFKRLYMSPHHLLTLCRHRKKDIPRWVCWSQIKNEGHGGKARLPWSFQLRPSKISQQTADQQTHKWTQAGQQDPPADPWTWKLN